MSILLNFSYSLIKNERKDETNNPVRKAEVDSLTVSVSIGIIAVIIISIAIFCFFVTRRVCKPRSKRPAKVYINPFKSATFAATSYRSDNDYVDLGTSFENIATDFGATSSSHQNFKGNGYAEDNPNKSSVSDKKSLIP